MAAKERDRERETKLAVYEVVVSKPVKGDDALGHFWLFSPLAKSLLMSKYHRSWDSRARDKGVGVWGIVDFGSSFKRRQRDRTVQLVGLLSTLAMMTIMTDGYNDRCLIIMIYDKAHTKVISQKHQLFQLVNAIGHQTTTRRVLLLSCPPTRRQLAYNLIRLTLVFIFHWIHSVDD